MSQHLFSSNVAFNLKFVAIQGVLQLCAFWSLCEFKVQTLRWPKRVWKSCWSFFTVHLDLATKKELVLAVR